MMSIFRHIGFDWLKQDQTPQPTKRSKKRRNVVQPSLDLK